MVASSTLEAIVQPRTEVDAKENGLFHESTETVWHASDDHQRALSFSDVHPADITVWNLGVEVDIITSVVDALKAKFTRSKVSDVEGDVVGGTRRKILKDVSGVFPAGTLTAIIGASGSGKVRLHPHTLDLADLISLVPLADDLPQRSFAPYAGTKPHYHRKHTLQRIPRPPHSHYCLCHPNRRPDSIPHCPRNPTIRRIPSTPLIHHFSAA